MRFSGKVVLVTGAGSGIGAATAELFAQEGARVALVDRDEATLAEVAQQCAAHGAPPLALRADLSIDEEVTTIVEKAVKHFGKLDVLVNVAGFHKEGSLLDGKILQAYDEVMKINLRAVILLSAQAAPYLIQTKGNIINMSSIGSLSTAAMSTWTPYFISKHAVDHFTRCAALELAASGVRVNSINPGSTRTRFMENSGVTDAKTVDELYELFKRGTALKRISEASEVAELILFVASDKARSVTGSIHVIDNGALLRP